jgi:hypothetical protein
MNSKDIEKAFRFKTKREAEHYLFLISGKAYRAVRAGCTVFVYRRVA